jgi:zinc protease
LATDQPTIFADAARHASRASGHDVTLETAHRHNATLAAARFRLENGLGIVLMPDHRAPVFAFQTWFRVGSKHEDPTRTGLAHLFEHLMFKGTARHPTGELDREMEMRGSQTNAATWFDWTYYTQVLAARGDNLATIVDFEVDRMTGLLLDQETFESEREVVKNERRMTVDDSIAGTLSETLYATAYAEHPYRSPTIGSMAHLDATSLEDLHRFYRAYYAPNNATLVLVGDLEPAATLAELAAAYGSLSPQQLPEQHRPTEPRQQEPRQRLIERPIVAPQLMIGFHSPAQDSADFPLVEMLSEILVAGDNARLFHRLVTVEHLATELFGYQTPLAEPSLYELVITAKPGVDPQRIVDTVQEELDRIRSEEVSTRELEKACNGLEVALLDSLSTPEGCAEALGHFETNHGNIAMAFAGPETWSTANAASLRRVASELFRPDNRTTVVAVPGTS